MSELTEFMKGLMNKNKQTTAHACKSLYVFFNSTECKYHTKEHIFMCEKKSQFEIIIFLNFLLFPLYRCVQQDYDALCIVYDTYRQMLWTHSVLRIGSRCVIYRSSGINIFELQLRGAAHRKCLRFTLLKCINTE